MLGHEVPAVDNSRIKVVTQILQSVSNDSERLLLVVRDQILDVLEEKRARPFSSYDSRDIEEQRSLGFAQESVRASQGILLRDAGNAERLAGETGEQDVVVRHLGNVDRGDVA